MPIFAPYVNSYHSLLLWLVLCGTDYHVIAEHDTDLVDVVAWYGVVERTVEVIQQFHDLYRRTFGRQHREPDNIREVDRGARIHLWSHITSCLQFIRNKTNTQHQQHML